MKRRLYCLVSVIVALLLLWGSNYSKDWFTVYLAISSGFTFGCLTDWLEKVFDL